MDRNYSPSHVANFFLDKGSKADVPISQLKLLKLVYIGYGWVLALIAEKLFEEPILAWPHGPVVRSLYDEFKHNGKEPIKDFSIEFDLESLKVKEPRIPSSDEDVSLILDYVWKVYSPYSAWALRNKTHEDNTPWSQTFDRGRRDTVIPDELIQDHFQRKISEYLDAE